MCQQIAHCKRCEQCQRHLPTKIDIVWCDKQSNENAQRARLDHARSPHACEDLRTTMLPMDYRAARAYDDICFGCKQGRPRLVRAMNASGAVFPHFGMVPMPPRQ